MNDTKGLTVYLDDNQIDYTAQSQSDFWLLTFTYHHSTHTVTIKLGSATVQARLGSVSALKGVGDYVVYIVAAAMAVVIAVMAIALKSWKRSIAAPKSGS